MYRRYRERRRRRNYERSERRWNRPRLTSPFRTPAAQIAVLLIVALVIFIILQSAGR